MSLKRLAVHAALSTHNGQYYHSNATSSSSSSHSANANGHYQGLQTMRSNAAGSFHGNVNVLLGG